MCQNGSPIRSRFGGHVKIDSDTVSQRAFHPAWLDRAPYVMATIELEEGVRMVSEVLDADPDAIQIGQRVEVSFEPLEDFGLTPLIRLSPV